jgi:DNA helicase-2/ATP-dependent DNA helicase PcrA
LAIEAVAGSGKTTTLVKAASLIESKSIGFLAFNKAIADELQRRLPSHVEIKTFNSVGHAALCRAKCKFNEGKLKKILDQAKDGIPYHLKTYMADIFRLVNLAKSEGIIPKAKGINSANVSLSPDEPDTWRKLVHHHGLKVSEAPAFIDGVWEIAREILIKSIKQNTEFDFSDQIYFPFVYNLNLKTYDVLFVDEAQDVSRIQHFFIDKMLNSDGGRLVLCGDSNQAIYGFRGADSESIQRLVEKYNCSVLPLSISYRCSKSVIREAQRLVPAILAREDAGEGKVLEYFGLNLYDLKEKDMVLSRFNYNLISVALALLERSIKFTYQGEDLTKEIVGVIKRSRATNINSLQKYIDSTIEELKEAKNESYDPSKVARLIDVCKMCKAFISIKGSRDVDTLKSDIESFFKQATGNRSGILISTIHRAKGLEADRVFLVAEEVKEEDGKKPMLDWVAKQEKNLTYVAITRAQNELHLVTVREDDLEARQPSPIVIKKNREFLRN